MNIFRSKGTNLGTQVDDLAQETLIKVIKSIHTLRDVKSFPAWIGRIAARELANFYRSQHGDVALTPEIAPLTGKSTGRAGSEFMSPREAGEEDTTLRDIIRKEDTARLHQAIEKLPTMFHDQRHGIKSRDILIDFALQGKAIKEIAADYNIPIGTVKRIIHVAKARLLKLLSVESKI